MERTETRLKLFILEVIVGMSWELFFSKILEMNGRLEISQKSVRSGCFAPGLLLELLELLQWF